MVIVPPCIVASVATLVTVPLLNPVADITPPLIEILLPAVTTPPPPASNSLLFEPSFIKDDDVLCNMNFNCIYNVELPNVVEFPLSERVNNGVVTPPILLTNLYE